MLNDLQIKQGYETPPDDVSKDFYNPILQQSVSYDRIAGYFSSKSLAYFSKGIEGLINNGGKYRLIISNEISEEDYNLIRNGYANRKLKENCESILSNQVDTIHDKKELANLAYLIEIGLVDIKIGFITDGLFHAKVGIFTDEQSNSILFSGSLNETENAIKHNFEAIDVKKSWTDSETAEYINQQKQKFNDLWSGKNKDGMLFVKSINDIVKNKLAHYNRGKLIMEDQLLTPNSLVLYMKGNELAIQDNLSNPLRESRKLRRIKSDFLINDRLWNFKPNIGYKTIEDRLIPDFTKLSQQQGFEFIAADSVWSYIESSRFEIDKISKQGVALKSESDIFNDELGKFKEILNTQIVRELRPAQLWVSFYMTLMQRVGNFSVPGAGKTAMVYGTYAYLSAPQINKVDKLLVIGPKSSFLAWKTEFKAVFGDKRQLHVLDVQDPKFDSRDLYKNTDDYNLILVNYESLPKYSAALENIINKKTMLIFDEVHKIKGIKAERPKYAMPLANVANYKFALSGTPIPNGYIDIYNLLHLLYNDEYRDYFGFTPNELDNADESTADEINEKLFPFFWRVTKKDLNVPKANKDTMIKLRATDKEQKVIDILWKKYRSQPFKLYIRLIQMASNPDLLQKAINKSLFMDTDLDDSSDGSNLDFEFSDEMEDEPDYTEEELKTLDELHTSSKFESAVQKAIELIEDDHVPVVWAIFVDTIDKFAKRIEARGYRVAKVYGAVPAAEREKIITDFQKGKYDLLISNPHTLAESVSLHRVSHDALYLEYSFNLTHMLQSRDRIHRLGLPDGIETNYYYFQLLGQVNQRQPIDEHIYDRLAQKRDLMIQAIEGKTLQPENLESNKAEIEAMMQKFMGV
ncbi:SNF2-related protein [Lentilactobacillus sp. Marseille-Q4993]|uniref:SNF2-related protein n=1 Tax=Lentilactobacillus sp. Marseille-Q4993 TaxID=3039492 RepID=UPI0024BCE05F|nr:SNF2-related protein [Lentilactobacillus sp. Marseille-Q4993]